MTKPSAPASIEASTIARFCADQNGATAIEYAMIASGVAVAIAATVFLVGNSVNGMFTKLSGMFPG